MGDLPKNILRAIIFILVQVFILNKIPPLHQFITPYLYFLFILWLPYRTSRPALTFIGFIYGLSLDYFLKTPGLHAAACCLVAYLRPFVINILISKEDSGFNYTSPAPSSMGWSQYMVYAFVLSLAHNSWLVFLEWLQLKNFLYLTGKIIATTGVSFLLILITEGLFYRKQKFKTNI